MSKKCSLCGIFLPDYCINDVEITYKVNDQIVLSRKREVCPNCQSIIVQKITNSGFFPAEWDVQCHLMPYDGKLGEHCLTDCTVSSIDYDKNFPPGFCPHSGGVVCWKKRETTEKRPSLFDKITASPEVLAEKFVFSKGERYWRRRRCETVCYEVWWSALTGEEYKSKARAIAATVERLKEVYQ